MTWRLPTGDASNTFGLIQITNYFAHMEPDGTRIMTAKHSRLLRRLHQLLAFLETQLAETLCRDLRLNQRVMPIRLLRFLGP